MRAIQASGSQLAVGTILALTALLLGAPKVVAQELIVAFGDSVTAGQLPFDEENAGGYPRRLQAMLRASDLPGVTVINSAVGGETTAEGLTRINGVIAANNDADLFIIMEGTNDVNLISDGLISVDSVAANLEAMARKVRAEAMDVLYATVIPRPPWAKRDRMNVATFELVFALRELTSTGNRSLAEPFSVFDDRAQEIFDEFYFMTDPVGHPNSAGFELMAEIFRDKILGLDTLAPIVSGFSKNGSTQSLSAGDDLFAIVHESGEGIRQNQTYFTISGRPVDGTVEGSQRRTVLSYRVVASDLACAASITVRTEDRADPENIRNRLVAELQIPGANSLRGDVNGDCRVDGLDLSLMGRSFGARQDDTAYSAFADTDKDRRVDGQDLARLARNFGKSSK